MLRLFVLRVICAALICSITTALTKKTAVGNTVAVLCGLFLTVNILQPPVKLDLDALEEVSFPVLQEGKAVAARGEEMSQQALGDIIKQETEAYILDKAAAIETDFTVEVFLSSEHIPVSARLCGDFSDREQMMLADILENDLGITKENQLWTGQN